MDNQGSIRNQDWRRFGQAFMAMLKAPFAHGKSLDFDLKKMVPRKRNNIRWALHSWQNIITEEFRRSAKAAGYGLYGVVALIIYLWNG